MELCAMHGAASQQQKIRRNYFYCTLQLTGIAFQRFRLQLDLGSLDGRWSCGSWRAQTPKV
jgi:hypothetical protein